MINNYTILILSIIILALLFACFKLYNDNLALKGDKTTTEKFNADLVSIKPGDHGIVPNIALVYNEGKSNEHSFKVTFEVSILEVTKEKLKIKVLDCVTDDSVARDPKNKPGLLSIMNNSWIDRKKFELIVDDTHRRDIKLGELLQK